MRKARLSSRLKWNGLVFDTKHFGEVVVEDYISCDQVVVRFKDTGNITTVTSSQLKGGRVKDTSVPTVCGVGVTNGVRTQVDGKILREYAYWKHMLIRCYDKNFKIKNPTYLYCEASENFKDYSYFFDWCKTQKGFNVLGWQLDKDILSKGVKLYSEDTCCFVPREINQVFCKANKTRGKCLIGVSKVNGRYLAQVSVFGVNKKLGCFDTELEAFAAYKQAKEVYIKQLAEKFDAKIVTGEKNNEFLSNPTLNLTEKHRLSLKPFSADILLKDGDNFMLGNTEIKYITTPGHTSGCGSYIFDDTIISGDTLFCESYGRTDFPTGDDAEMAKSIRKLKNLEGDYRVIPGHGPTTTLDHERKYNPLMRIL